MCNKHLHGTQLSFKQKKNSKQNKKGHLLDGWEDAVYEFMKEHGVENSEKELLKYAVKFVVCFCMYVCMCVCVCV